MEKYEPRPPGSLPESAFDALGIQSDPLEVRQAEGKLFDGRELPEFDGHKWPCIYDIGSDCFRLATQEDLNQLVQISSAWGSISAAVGLQLLDGSPEKEKLEKSYEQLISVALGAYKRLQASRKVQKED